MKFRKKPVVIEAIRIEIGIKSKDVTDFCPAARPVHPEFGEFEIETLEGTMRASRGDWIIKGVKGEFYPCKPDIFEQTYERVEE